jgi:hypothetical protein
LVNSTPADELSIFQEVDMLQSACPRLKGLAKLMRETYDLRSKLILRDGSDMELLKVDYDLIRIHRVIGRHRRYCGQCKPWDARAKASFLGVRLPSGVAPVLPYDIAG